MLQAIESALDNHELVLADSSSATNAVRRIPQHKDFRLFATQNPNSGFFKGKREQLSTSFLSRFQPLEFRELPEEEWVEVVAKLLIDMGTCVGFSTAMILCRAHSA